jgi:hypothetical protein
MEEAGIMKLKHANVRKKRIKKKSRIKKTAGNSHFSQFLRQSLRSCANFVVSSRLRFARNSIFNGK